MQKQCKVKTETIFFEIAWYFSWFCFQGKIPWCDYSERPLNNNYINTIFVNVKPSVYDYFCTDRLNWARRTSRGWWDESDDKMHSGPKTDINQDWLDVSWCLLFFCGQRLNSVQSVMTLFLFCLRIPTKTHGVVSVVFTAVRLVNACSNPHMTLR